MQERRRTGSRRGTSFRWFEQVGTKFCCAIYSSNLHFIYPLSHLSSLRPHNVEK